MVMTDMGQFLMEKSCESWTNQKPALGCPGGSVVKNLPASAGDTSLIPDREDPTGHGANESMVHNH